MVKAPHDLWERLGILSECCEVAIHSRSGLGTFLAWEVVIHPKGKAVGPIAARSASLVDAIVQAVDQADERGWPGSI